MAIGRVNTGGGGTGGELTINAPAGVTVIAVNSATEKTYTKTANSSGVAVFKGLPEGSYNVHIEQGSNETEPITVTVAYKSSATIAWFAATIDVTYPAGSTCTCTKGGTTFTAPDTTGSWTCTVPSTGTWTVSCTNGSKTKSKDVSITADGESKSVSLGYEVYLYNEGDECTALTGGWTGEAGATGSYRKQSNRIYLAGIDKTGGYASAWTVNKIDLTDVSTVYFDIETSRDNSAAVGVNRNTPSNEDAGWSLHGTNKFVAYSVPANGRSIASVDVSALTGLYYIEASVDRYGSTTSFIPSYVYRVWTE